MKIIFLLLATFFSSIAYGKTLVGDNCRVEITERKSKGTNFTNIYVEFDQDKDEKIYAYTSIYGINSDDYEQLFVRNESGNFDDYPYDLQGGRENNTYHIYYYEQRPLNGEALGGYRHETLAFQFDQNQNLIAIDAEYQKAYSFPKDLVSGKTINKQCRL